MIKNLQNFHSFYKETVFCGIQRSRTDVFSLCGEGLYVFLNHSVCPLVDNVGNAIQS